MKKEVPVKVGRKSGLLDLASPKKAIEIERSGDKHRLAWACKKLVASRKKIKILRVPEWHKSSARKIASKISRSITVQNLSGE